MIAGFIDRIPSLIVAIVVFLAFYGLSHLAAHFIQRAVSKRRENVALVFARLIAGATVLFGLLVAVSIVAPSFQVSDLIKILGIGGVAIGFAFQNILQNFLAGLLLLWSEPFRVGDEIKVDAFEGRVQEIQTPRHDYQNLRRTRSRDSKRRSVHSLCHRKYCHGNAAGGSTTLT